MSTQIIHFSLSTVTEMETVFLLINFMQTSPHKATIVLISFMLSFSASAKEIILFNDHEEAASNYNLLRKSIEPGDTLVFSKNISFKVNTLLGCGKVTCIYELTDYPNQALRIPKATSVFTFNLFNTFYFENFIDFFTEGKKQLDEYRIPSVQIYENQRLQFVRIEKIDPITDLTLFLHDPFSFSIEERFKMESDLIDFARKTSLFSSIGDFNSSQLQKKINLAIDQERYSCTGLFNQIQAETN